MSDRVFVFYQKEVNVTRVTAGRRRGPYTGPGESGVMGMSPKCTVLMVPQLHEVTKNDCTVHSRWVGLMVNKVSLYYAVKEKWN